MPGYALLPTDGGYDVAQLTAAINNIDAVSTACSAVFGPVGQGVAVHDISLEIRDDLISRVEPRPRGAPPGLNSISKAKLLSFQTPHFPVTETLSAESFQDRRAFGTAQPATIPAALTEVLVQLRLRVEQEWEALRLGALKGKVLGCNGLVIADLFEAFGIMNSQGYYAPETFSFELDDRSPLNEIRTTCHRVRRYMERSLKLLRIPEKAQLWALCGDDFFDSLVSHPNVKNAYAGAGTESAIEKLADSYVPGVFDHGGVFWQNYLGSHSAGIEIASDEAVIHWRNVDGLYCEYFSPASFIEAVNKPGLPLYAKVAVGEMQRQVKVWVESNPLPLALKPRALVRATLS